MAHRSQPFAPFAGPLPSPIEILEKAFKAAGMSLVQAAFRYSYFIDPARVRERCPYFPGRARTSRKFYPDLDRGQTGTWKGASVRLGNNARAQMAWERYTRRPVARSSGYGVRHIWGHPWDPAAFTAGWNLCYMPFWVGMLTEDQHPHEPLVRAVQQASYDLYFRHDPVCKRPDFVVDQGLPLIRLLGGAEIQILGAEDGMPRQRRAGRPAHPGNQTSDDKVRAIRAQRNASWSNIKKAAAALAGLPHKAFSTRNVENTSKSIVRRMGRETGLSSRQLVSLVRRVATQP